MARGASEIFENDQYYINKTQRIVLALKVFGHPLLVSITVLLLHDFWLLVLLKEIAASLSKLNGSPDPEPVEKTIGTITFTIITKIVILAYEMAYLASKAMMIVFFADRKLAEEGKSLIKLHASVPWEVWHFLPLRSSNSGC